eukprot:TRINITY_DN5810_c0_g1_i1.p1 TRINITY_DN5810_c0_g1~~TRINITY_DN5810_c0_g1_i1.p1  ORF type:complete len:271 (+),score=88.84 TRINITY_DN5810_c0_g1_i1:36-815(+)
MAAVTGGTAVALLICGVLLLLAAAAVCAWTFAPQLRSWLSQTTPRDGAEPAAGVQQRGLPSKASDARTVAQLPAVPPHHPPQPPTHQLQPQPPPHQPQPPHQLQPQPPPHQPQPPHQLQPQPPQPPPPLSTDATHAQADGQRWAALEGRLAALESLLAAKTAAPPTDPPLSQPSAPAAYADLSAPPLGATWFPSAAAFGEPPSAAAVAARPDTASRWQQLQEGAVPATAPVVCLLPPDTWSRGDVLVAPAGSLPRALVA